jgi:hypothetical protein
MTQFTRELIELAERVEKAEGADDELDLAVFRAIGAPVPFQFANKMVALTFDESEGCYFASLGKMRVRYTPPAYTVDLNAAMSLVPEGGRWFKCGVNHAQTGAAETRMFVCGPADEDGRWQAGLHVLGPERRASHGAGSIRYDFLRQG